jgi:hypothetical protein
VGFLKSLARRVRPVDGVIISVSRANKKTAKVADFSIDLANCQPIPAV